MKLIQYTEAVYTKINGMVAERFLQDRFNREVEMRHKKSYDQKCKKSENADMSNEK